jgi:signal peptidase II
MTTGRRLTTGASGICTELYGSHIASCINPLAAVELAQTSERLNEPVRQGAIEVPMAVLFVSAILLIVLDQATKAFVRSGFREGQFTSFGGVPIRRMVNRRGSHGFCFGPTTLLAIWIVDVAILLLLVQVGPFFQHVVAQVALGLAIGGAGGNLVDRLWRGSVLDFVDLRFWPVFNLADTAIVAGALLAVVFML